MTFMKKDFKNLLSLSTNLLVQGCYRNLTVYDIVTV